LGECGDPSCPTYRPKRPEVRMAVEKCILETLATGWFLSSHGAWGTPNHPRKMDKPWIFVYVCIFLCIENIESHGDLGINHFEKPLFGEWILSQLFLKECLDIDLNHRKKNPMGILLRNLWNMNGKCIITSMA
jgi:hypothetical protein